MNLSVIIFEALQWLGEAGIIWAVVVLLLALFVAGIKLERYRSSAPALMTSLGILGTFCGIYLALYPLDFSPGKMNDSVQALLEGMRTAFMTSLLGLFFAIIFRVTASPLSRLIASKETIPIERRQVLDRLDAIKQAISGDGDSSLVTQFQKLRDESRDGFSKLDGLSEAIRDALLKNLDTLIQEIRDIIGKQLGDSLQNLIENIEEALIKQFGKTFIEFNEATQAIKRWQEEHRDQVEKLTAAFNLSAEKIKQIAEDCDRIPETMEQLRETIRLAKTNVDSLNGVVEVFAEMRKNAEESFPVIKQHLDKIGEDLAQSAQSFDGLEETIRTTFKNAEEETANIVKNHSQNLELMTGNLRDVLENTQRESSEKINQMVHDSLEEFNRQMANSVNTLAREWGGNMVSIAKQCADLIAQTR
ncbi:MAG: MotA/TolQ/ExbB proton channel family protein [Gammaproteobacteria bacterium]|nr:MotA/TolQ/ExbB proton channel family protein [Gammaproteobacteria bacterium]